MEALQKQLKESGTWDHLAATLLHIVREQPKNPVALFELYSQSVKTPKTKFTAVDEKERLGAIEALSKASELLKPPLQLPVEEDEDPPEPEAAPEDMPHIPDLVYNAGVFGAAGVCLGEEEIYRVSLSINSFVIEEAKKENHFSSVRFVGKILGINADYYVIECGKEEWPEPEEDAPKLPEPMGSGANKYQYWASNLAGAESAWTSLPPVTPKQLAVAKNVRRLFTGDLTADVRGYPYFPWKEAGFLRAQLAAITHGTVISPVGVWEREEDAEDPAQTIKLSEAYTPPLCASKLLNPKMWCHHRQYIMPELGLCAPPEPEEEVDEEKKPKNPIEMLSTCDVDPRSKGQWRISLCNTFGVRPEYDEHAIVCAHSLKWPGAYCVVKGKTIVNIYIGNGQPKRVALAPIPIPPQPCGEFVLPPEQEDPLKTPEPESKEDEKKHPEDEDVEED